MSESQDMGMDEEMEIDLPPAIMQLLRMIESDQRKLLKDRNVYKDPDQLRKFLATTLVERISQLVKMFGTSLYDLHSLAVSNSTQLQSMRRWAGANFRKVGVEVNDGDPFGGLGTDQLDAVSQSLYALGSYLQGKYPEDKEAEEKYNATVVAVNELIGTLMGNQSVADDDEDEDDDEGDGESGDGDADAGDSEVAESDVNESTDEATDED